MHGRELPLIGYNESFPTGHGTCSNASICLSARMSVRMPTHMSMHTCSKPGDADCNSDVDGQKSFFCKVPFSLFFHSEDFFYVGATLEADEGKGFSRSRLPVDTQIALRSVDTQIALRSVDTLRPCGRVMCVDMCIGMCVDMSMDMCAEVCYI